MDKTHPSNNNSPIYSETLKEVIESEKEYILQRRKQYSQPIPENPDDIPDDLWGLAISGGGIRSATLALGMMQKFMVEGLFRKFDYMSTVSGGGYIGSCLTSLMNNPPESFVKPDKYSVAEAQNIIPGLDKDTSPFVLLMETRKKEKPVEEPKTSHLSAEDRARWMPAEMEPDAKASNPSDPPEYELVIEYDEPEEVKIDARHQIHHLRTFGEYLSVQKTIFSTPVQRLVGAVLAGIVHNILLFTLALTFFVSLNYLGFEYISKGYFFKQLRQFDQKFNEGESVSEKLSLFWSEYINKFIGNIIDSIRELPEPFLAFCVVGAVTAIIFIFWVAKILWQVREDAEAIREGKIEPQSKSGDTQEEYHERRFIRSFNFFTILGGPLLTTITWMVGIETGVFEVNNFRQDYWLVFGLPAAFAIGLFLAIYLILPFTSFSSRKTRFARSMDSAMRGGAFYAVLISVAMPFLILVLFSFSTFFAELFVPVTSSVSSLLSIGIGYLAVSGNPTGEGITSRILQRIKIPAITISMVLFVVLAASAISGMLVGSENPYLAEWFLGGSFLLFILLGFFVNSNHLSLHYFYRDRLSEAYLKTDARVLRDKSKVDKQGLPLVNLRNDENLRLVDLGVERDQERNITGSHARTPYHIIITALNLLGSNELVRKDLKSDHFIFTRNYIGSNSTGYVRTDKYRQGKTKLARAMMISAAAMNSGMGFYSFFAQSFLTTLLNLRLGYWMENPWRYRNFGKEDWKDPMWKFTFWPYYLVQELFGISTADQRLVNVSDGGHTGDNLGILPLLQRRCKYIVICDFEEDRKFLFESFNHAVRMANIEENIDIEIDLRPLVPTKPEPEKITHSPRSVVIGRIGYPDHTYGTIFYLKSSLNQEILPVNSFNYYNKHPDFPHQSTADQFFDDAQFEAYRSLGFHIARQASREIKRFLEKENNPV